MEYALHLNHIICLKLAKIIEAAEAQDLREKAKESVILNKNGMRIVPNQWALEKP